jgi:orotate phosphoribosyltransferase
MLILCLKRLKAIFFGVATQRAAAYLACRAARGEVGDSQDDGQDDGESDSRGNRGMTDDEALAEFRAAGALLEGHFILSSGKHSANYLQCARVLMNAERAALLARALTQKIPREIRQEIEIVVSPAMGGLIIGHEMGRALGVDAIFLERPEGTFELRRGFTLREGQKVLMVEDVVTTGLSSRQAMDAVRAAGAIVIAEAALVDRSAGEAALGVPFYPLVSINFPVYDADKLPPELAAIPAGKPGSRKV